MEKNTAARLATELRDAGFEVTTGVGGTGVVALLKNGTGFCGREVRHHAAHIAKMEILPFLHWLFSGHRIRCHY